MEYKNHLLFGASLIILLRLVDCNHQQQQPQQDFMNITISYSSQSSRAVAFFKNKLKADIIKEFAQCPTVRWNFMPCATSMLTGGTLKCWMGEAECETEKIQSCAKIEYAQSDVNFGYFVSCVMNHDGQANSAKDCSTNELWEKIDACSKTELASKQCNYYWEVTNNQWKLSDKISIMYDTPFNLEISEKAANTDFKAVTCDQLKNRNLQCGACP